MIREPLCSEERLAGRFTCASSCSTSTAPAANLGWRFLGVGTGEQATRLEREGAIAVIDHYLIGSFLP